MSIPLDIYIDLPIEYQQKYVSRLPNLTLEKLNSLSNDTRQNILTLVFLDRVNKQSGVFLNGLTTECWEWTGAICGPGYGQIQTEWALKLGSYYSHRISYILFKEPIPDDKMIRHKCDNRKCVNPDHLEIGVSKDNVKDMMERNPTRYKLNPTEYPIIVERMKTEMLKDIAKDYDMNWKSISRALEKAGLRPDYNQKKLTTKQVEEIKQSTETYAVLSKKYDVAQSVICKVKKNEY